MPHIRRITDGLAAALNRSRRLAEISRHTGGADMDAVSTIAQIDRGHGAHEFRIICTDSQVFEVSIRRTHPPAHQNEDDHNSLGFDFRNRGVRG